MIKTYIYNPTPDYSLLINYNSYWKARAFVIYCQVLKDVIKDYYDFDSKVQYRNILKNKLYERFDKELSIKNGIKEYVEKNKIKESDNKEVHHEKIMDELDIILKALFGDNVSIVVNHDNKNTKKNKDDEEDNSFADPMNDPDNIPLKKEVKKNDPLESEYLTDIEKTIMKELLNMKNGSSIRDIINTYHVSYMDIFRIFSKYESIKNDI
jgi:hypothetical protein